MRLLPDCRTALTAALLLAALAAPTLAAEQLAVEFVTSRGHLRTVRVDVDPRTATRLATSAGALEPHLQRAREAYARQLGYSAQTGGADFYKIVPGLRINRITLGRTELSARRENELDPDYDVRVERTRKRRGGAGQKKERAKVR